MLPGIPSCLETERLLLRGFEASDWRDLHACYSDPECVRFTFGKPCSEEATWRMLATMIGHWSMRGYGPYAVVERASGRVIGPVGLWYPHGWPEPEIKWALARDCWGRGYAREAALAVRKMAARALPDLHLISFIHPQNSASIRLAESIGARFEQELPYRGEAWRVYRHPAPAEEGG